jgi:hypothetical protein
MRIAILVVGTALLCLLPISLKAEAYGSGWYGEAQASVGHEDNISRSFLSTDEVSDEIASFSIGGGHSQKVGERAQLVFTGYVTVNTHNEYDDLDNIATSLGAIYTYQPNPAFNAVWYGASATATYLDYENSDEREGGLFNVDLNINKRIGTKTTGHLGYRYADLVFIGKSHLEEDNDAAFDTATHEIYFGIDHEVLPLVYAYAEYAFRHGGAWSNSSFSTGVVEYDQETIDRVFDECESTDLRCQPRYAGRIVNDIHRLNVGFVFPIKTVNIDLSGVYYDAEGDNGKKYKDWFMSVGLIWNF